MFCIVLVGGLIGCGKTTLINYILECEKTFFNAKNEKKEENLKDMNKSKSQKLCKIIFDELCSLEEQANMMYSIKGWRGFRADLLMAAEHFINFLYESQSPELGPLTERSSMLFEKLVSINSSNNLDADVIFIVEDNFYYRSMRYDWFQVAKRANIGFCEVFSQCSLDTAISRNALRGYNIPDKKIKSMASFLEYPDPVKYKWEKYSILHDSTEKPNLESIKIILFLIEEASRNPAEMIMMAEKIEAQAICSKNIVHQADNILRKIVSNYISTVKDHCEATYLKYFTTKLIEVRQVLLNYIRQGYITFPESLLENLKTSGIQSVKEEFKIIIMHLFEEEWQKSVFDDQFFKENDFCKDMELMSLKNLSLN